MIYQSEHAVFIREGENAALFRVYPEPTNESRAEVEIMVYRQGYLADAVDGVLHGGKMPAQAQATDRGLFKRIVSLGIERFSGTFCLWWDASDMRRADCYERMMRRAGINFERFTSTAFQI